MLIPPVKEALAAAEKGKKTTYAQAACRVSYIMILFPAFVVSLMVSWAAREGLFRFVLQCFAKNMLTIKREELCCVKINLTYK